MKKRILATTLLLVISVCSFAGCQSQTGSTTSSNSSSNSSESTAWEPTGPVTIVAGAAAGSGYDTSARSFAQVFNSTGIVEQPVKVINEAGGAGQVAFTAFNGKYGGKNDTLIVASTATISGAVANQWEVGIDDFTPIAKLVNDAFVVVCAEGNTEFDTIDKIAAKLKEDPKSIKFGAAAPPDPDYIGLVLFLQSIDVDIEDVEYVVYDGGGEQLPALMGGHIDVALSGVSEFAAAAESGQVKPVAVASEERMGGPYADTPTFLESGYDLVYGNWRGFWGPKDMSEEAVTYWKNVAKAVVETPEWEEICSNMQWTSEPVIDDYDQWLADFQDEITEALKEAGII